MAMEKNGDWPGPGVDPAALGSASVGAILALIMTPGRYDSITFGVGLTLASIVAAYYRPLHPAPTNLIDAVTRACAFGATAGLLASTILSWPIQDIIIGTPPNCQITAVAPNQSPTQITSQIDECAGDAASPWVAWAWLISGIIFAIAHYWYVRARQAHPQ
jgi:hypothetical protein